MEACDNISAMTITSLYVLALKIALNKNWGRDLISLLSEIMLLIILEHK